MGLHDQVMTEDDEEIAKKMILVGLWCIQTIPSNQPSIGKVVKMLEGNLESLQIPLKHFLSSPPRPLISSPITEGLSDLSPDYNIDHRDDQMKFSYEILELKKGMLLIFKC